MLKSKALSKDIQEEIRMAGFDLTLMGTFRKEGIKRDLNQNKYLNLPDLQFFNWCYQQYIIQLINGFMIMGSKKFFLVEQYTLSFLRFVLYKKLDSDPQKFIRFGSGGLTKQLAAFITTVNKESDKSSLYMYTTLKKLVDLLLSLPLNKQD